MVIEIRIRARLQAFAETLGWDTVIGPPGPTSSINERNVCDSFCMRTNCIKKIDKNWNCDTQCVYIGIQYTYIKYNRRICGSWWMLMLTLKLKTIENELEKLIVHPSVRILLWTSVLTIHFIADKVIQIQMEIDDNEVKMTQSIF